MKQYDIDEYTNGTEEKYPVTYPYVYAHLI